MFKTIEGQKVENYCPFIKRKVLKNKTVTGRLFLVHSSLSDASPDLISRAGSRVLEAGGHAEVETDRSD